MHKLSIYLHPETLETSREVRAADFVGHSYPLHQKFFRAVHAALPNYPRLRLRKADFSDYVLAHSPGYLETLQQMAEGKPGVVPPKLSLECAGLEYCLPGYCYGLGGMHEAIDRMRTGELERAFVFSLGGHHAHKDWGHGYCLLNAQVAAARYAQRIGFKHPLIIDWDIHHGDGTQDILWGDNSIHCLSIHSAVDLYMLKASDAYAGTTVAGHEAGHTNIPLLDSNFDSDFCASIDLPGEFYRAQESLGVFSQTIHELAFRPDIIFIFAGCDGHAADCGNGITDWDVVDFRILTQEVLRLARRTSSPILSCQGGGYNFSTTLAVTVAHLEELDQ